MPKLYSYLWCYSVVLLLCGVLLNRLNVAFAQNCGGLLSGIGSFWYPPNYPGSYPEFIECRWTITAPIGNVIQVQFTEPFGIPGRDFLAIVDGKYSNRLGPACSLKDYFALGTQGQDFMLIRADKADFTMFTSTSNALIAVFCAQGQRGSTISRRGFRGQFFPVTSTGINSPSITPAPVVSATTKFPFLPPFPFSPPTRPPVTLATTATTTQKPVVNTPFPFTAPLPPTTQPSVQTCGMPVQQPGQARIIGGHPATFGSWPYMVAIVDSRYNGQFCGGVLIDANWVLTAAHCVVDKPAQHLLLRIGGTDFNASAGNVQRGVDYRASFAIVQPSFNSQTFNNDIAMIRLSTSVVFNQFVKPICMPSEPPTPGMICFIAGYGLTTPLQRKKRQIDITASGSNRLMEADVPIVPHDTCQAFFTQAFPGLITLTNSHVCAGSIYPVSHDSCNGDSGGPLICRRSNHFEIVGLTSFGVGCGRSDVFGAYTNVWELLSWINSIRNSPIQLTPAAASIAAAKSMTIPVVFG